MAVPQAGSVRRTVISIKRPIILFPILPMVAISPILYIPQATERNTIGPAMADKSPIKRLNTGPIRFFARKARTPSGRKRHSPPHKRARATDRAKEIIWERFFFFGVNKIRFSPFLYCHTGATPILASSPLSTSLRSSSPVSKGSNCSPLRESSRRMR